jgi:hypothetical protein
MKFGRVKIKTKPVPQKAGKQIKFRGRKFLFVEKHCRHPERNNLKNCEAGGSLKEKGISPFAANVVSVEMT